MFYLLNSSFEILRLFNLFFCLLFIIQCDILYFSLNKVQHLALILFERILIPL